MTKTLGAILSLAALGACTEVDDRLGANLLPENQQMQIKVKTLANGVETYLYKVDSIPSSRLGYARLGRMNDAADGNVFGAQTNSALLQFIPLSMPYADEEGYGHDPIIDSMCISFLLADARGDSDVEQSFDVWEVIENEQYGDLHRDSTYYANFPIDDYIAGDKKLFEFTLKGRGDKQSRLFPTAEGKDFLDRIVNPDRITWEEYTTDSLFYKKFRGLYIAPAAGSPSAAAVYAADLNSSGLILYVRNHDSIDVSAIRDTVVTTFSFKDSDQQDQSTGMVSRWDNVSINMASFDYSGSTLGGLQTATNDFTDTLPDSPTQRQVYVQTMGGVGTYLRFPDWLVNEIRGLGEVDGEKADIMINQAMMRIWLDGDEKDHRVLDRAIGRLGSYLRMQNLYPIPDYQYITEMSNRQNQNTQNYILPYNGYMNRSNGYYELDITSYVQSLAKVKEGDPDFKYIQPVMMLGPEAFGVFDFGASALSGYDDAEGMTAIDHNADGSATVLQQMADDKLITIRLTYTVIKG